MNQNRVQRQLEHLSNAEKLAVAQVYATMAVASASLAASSTDAGETFAHRRDAEEAATSAMDALEAAGVAL